MSVSEQPMYLNVPERMRDSMMPPPPGFDPNAVTFLKSFVSQTYTGLTLDIMNPRPEDMSILDVAHHLARITRYGGAIRPEHYSVAEHSWIMAWFILNYWQELGITTPAKATVLAYEALMHDVGETWYGDIRAPLKKAFPEFKKCAKLTDEVAAIKWGFTIPTPKLIDQIDKRIVADEKKALLNPLANGNEWAQCDTEPLGVAIIGWSPTVAEHKWLDMYGTLAGRLFPDRLREEF